MTNAYLLIPSGSLKDVAKKAGESSAVVTAYTALWHPHLISTAELPPRPHALDNLPQGEGNILAIARKHLDQASEIIKSDLAALGATLLVADSVAGDDATLALLEPLGLPPVDAAMLANFFAIGYGYLGLQLLFQSMGQENPVDAWRLIDELREAAQACLTGDLESTRSRLENAAGVLHNGRQIVYPATINWVDLGLLPPDLDVAELSARTGAQSTINVLASGRDVERYAKQNPPLIEAIRDATTNYRMEVLAGPYSDRPWTLLPAESRNWELSKAATIYLEHLGREFDAFGSRTLAMISELPQLLMKHQYRYALHASFDGGRHPHFRTPKLHWTAPDGSVVETLARTAVDASREDLALEIFVQLAETIMNDRAATMVLGHWVNSGASWYQRLLKVQDFASVFGKFESFSDFFLHSSTPDRPTQTRTEEYATNYLDEAWRRKEANPISRWANLHRLRGQLDAARTLAALDHIVSGANPNPRLDLEEEVETEQPGTDARLEAYTNATLVSLAKAVLADAPPGKGFLLFNPCSFPRRACLEIPGLPASLAVDGPVRAVQAVDKNRSAVVVDVPGWGYTWIDASGAKAASSTPPPAPEAPLASGRKLTNEFLELEVDSKTGGIRGIWELRSGYSRLGQRIYHPGATSQTCRKVTVTANGPAFGEIKTEGQLIGQNRKSIGAFTQTMRIWRGRPMISVRLSVEFERPIEGDPKENYLACRWAWPDEKSIVAPLCGWQLQTNRSAEIETASLIELRERKLLTEIFPHGQVFHRRIGYRMLDSLLMVEGESRREFEFSIAFDLAHAHAAAMETFWPVSVIPVEQGAPKQGRTGWLAKLDVRNVLCTRMLPFDDAHPGVSIRLVETDGKSVRVKLQFAKEIQTAKLTNFRGQLIFDLYANETGAAVDFSPQEMLQVEATFWAYLDSNQGPHRYQRCALTN